MFGGHYSTLALQTVPASHAAVVNGILPLATAVIGAWLNRESLSRAFWACAVAGTLLVWRGYAWQRAHGSLHTADALMLVSVVLGGLGCASGAIATRYVSGPQAISWALILGLLGTLAIAWWSAPAEPSRAGASIWAAFAYLGLMSQWDRFFFGIAGLRAAASRVWSRGCSCCNYSLRSDSRRCCLANRLSHPWR